MKTLKVITLLGRQKFELSLKCLASFKKHCKTPFELIVLGDSTISEKDSQLLKDNLGISSVIFKSDRDSVINEKLSAFPNCLKFRERQVLAQKLFDPIFINEAPELNYLDSDIFFFKDFHGFPLKEDECRAPVFMHDIQAAYALNPLELIMDPGIKLPDSLNTGMISFPKKDFNLGLIEEFLARYGEKMATNSSACWSEQTCWAFLAGRLGCKLWDKEQLVIAKPKLPHNPEKAAAIHFVKSYRSLLPEFAENCGQAEGEAITLESSPAPFLKVTQFASQIVLRKFQ